MRAAEKELAAKGFSGARVEEIARRAKVKKQLLYHYFASKEALLDEILHRQIEQKALRVYKAPGEATDLLEYHFASRLGDLDWIRFLTWEAASSGNRRVHSERERREAFVQQAEELRRSYPESFASADLDPTMVLLAIYSLTTYPLAFPQITRMIAGQSATSEAFRDAWQRFLRVLGERLMDAGGSEA
ncbi:MAG: helix-turn-helix transcriptional regulator [bacterium]|nr:helix-turn-helix transcriptional regulator [bacterium]